MESLVDFGQPSRIRSHPTGISAQAAGDVLDRGGRFAQPLHVGSEAAIERRQRLQIPKHTCYPPLTAPSPA